jgi:hypothetical protein
MFTTAAAKSPNFDPSAWAGPTSDVPRPAGMYTASLLGGAWPTESESAMSAAAEELRGRATTHQQASDSAHARTRRVFDESWTDGAGAEAAYAHYRRENQAHETLYRSFDDAAAGMGRLAEDVGRAKRNMYSADAAPRMPGAPSATGTAPTPPPTAKSKKSCAPRPPPAAASSMSPQSSSNTAPSSRATAPTWPAKSASKPHCSAAN